MSIVRFITYIVILLILTSIFSTSLGMVSSEIVLNSLKAPGPNLLLTRKRIEEIDFEVNIAKNQMAIRAYNELIKTADSFLYKNPNPITGSIRAPKFYKYTEAQRRVSSQIGDDSVITYTLALAYAFSKDRIYGEKSREFLMSWINKCTIPEDGGDFWDILMGEKEGDTALVISYHFPKFIMAFDILKGLNFLSNEDIVRFSKWLRPFVEYLINHKPTIPNNHLSWKAVFLLCAGRALEDINIFNEGIKTLQDALLIQIFFDGSMPLELLRLDRSASYTLMNLEALVQGIWIVENHGIKMKDTRSFFGGNIELACSNFRDFLLDHEKWRNRYRFLIRVERINCPYHPSDWAWVFEIPINWLSEDSPLKNDMIRIINDRIYSLYPVRSYTMHFATLLFRKF